MRPFNHKAVVLGCGASGIAAALLLRREGAEVTALDRSAAPAETAAKLEAAGIRIIQSDGLLPEGAFDLCVVSPGVPVNAPWIQAARERGIPTLAELELGWSRRKPSTRVIAVTGSNGKSCAVKWIAESLVAAGYRAAIAGNYGPPACRVVCEQPNLDWLVLEVSSFQLETVVEFRADAGILLNLAPNHLDRHGDFDAYRAAKARLFSRTVSGDCCMVHESCAREVRAVAGGGGHWFTFGSKRASDFSYEDGKIICAGDTLADVTGAYFGNPVLGANAAGVLGALSELGVDLRAAERAARQFNPLPHRMELVAEGRGVRFINDSKATTLTALSAAVRMCGGGVRLIAGGLLKEYDLSGAKEVLAQHVRGVYLIGRASDQMAAAWSDVVPCRMCGTLDSAVGVAWGEAQPGETILLSPGCASFDQFKSFEARGEQFRKLAGLLAQE